MAEQDDVFSWRRDFKSVNWSGTLKYNSLRAAGAGVVWCLLGVVAGAKWQALQMLLFPICYYVFFLPIGLIAAWLSGLGVPWVGLLAAIFAFFVGVGDPLVFVLKKVRPDLVPAESVKFFSLKTVIFLLGRPAENGSSVAAARKELSSDLFTKR